MLEEVKRAIGWMTGQPLWLGLLLLGASAGVEYIFPPFPGDTVTLAGAMLIPLAGWPMWAVLSALVAGSVFGAFLDLMVGRWLSLESGRETLIHRWLAREEIASKIDRVTEKFERHGAIYIVLNRFIPAFRGVFFLAAGMARLSTAKVLFYAALSATLWNAALLLLGMAFGYNLERIVGFVEGYTRAAFLVLFVVVATWIGWGWWRKRSPDDR